ncbi:MAG: GntR family transcriptional regulator [Rhodoglobus sp.]
MYISIDAASSVPLFEQLVTAIREQVMGGELEAGDRLPAGRELAASLDINVHTVLRAYQVLRDEGFIGLRRGRGAVVADSARDYSRLSLDIDRVVAEAKRLELSPGALNALIRKAYE